MSKVVDAGQPNIFAVDDVAVNHTENGHLGDTLLAFTTFLCGHCDRTHVVLQCVNMDVQFNMSLPQKDAEKFADMLLNPQLQK